MMMMMMPIMLFINEKKDGRVRFTRIMECIQLPLRLTINELFILYILFH